MPRLDPWYRLFLANHHITEVYFTGQNGLHDKGASVSAGRVRLFKAIGIAARIIGKTAEWRLA